MQPRSANWVNIPAVLVAMSTGDVTTAASEENGEFCAAVAPATRTAGILTKLADLGCILA